MLNLRQYDELRHASPFRPFRIVMTDGARFIVPHREFTWRSPNMSTIVVAIEDGEVYHMIDPLHITRFEYIERNGRKRRGRRSSKTT
jgi:hypothetical protein